MSGELIALALSAASISFLHTASGPDHYLPFVVISRSRKWTISKTLFWTTLCGIGHILSSLLVGAIGLFLGWQLANISWFQNLRGDLSGWCLLVFGIIYLAYGITRAMSNRPHKHFDVYGSEVYVYEHSHGEPVYPKQRVRVTPLILFALFVMGPSEPLLPLLFYSGSRHSTMEIMLLIVVFAFTTVITMIGMVLIGLYGYSFFRTELIERYVHAIGGAVISICGIGMVFLNW
jgi:sulfite exporter TauE/SafE